MADTAGRSEGRFAVSAVVVRRRRPAVDLRQTLECMEDWLAHLVASYNRYVT